MICAVGFVSVSSAVGESSFKRLVYFTTTEKQVGMHSELERGTERLQVLFKPQQHALHQAKQAPCQLRTGMVPL